jgi:hypothetical protein
MAVSFLTAAQRDRYGRYPDVVTPNDLAGGTSADLMDFIAGP